MPVGAAIGAGVGAAASIGSALIGSSASKTASNQQTAAYQQGLAQQQSMFNTAQGALSPYYTAGQSVLPSLQKLLTPGASQTSALESLPGFQFQSQWGTQQATNELAARGLGGSSGPLATAVSNYNQGLAGTSFNNLVSQLQGFANTGASSAGALGGLAVQSGNAQAQTLGNIGTAQASGTLGSANALAGGLTGTANAVSGGATNALTLPILMSQLQSQGASVYGNPNSLFGSSPNYGGGTIYSGDAFGGSASNPLAGLTAEDYG